jgi:hypothetical protein
MKRNQFKTGYLIGVCLLWGLLTVISSCATTVQKREVSTSGFLKDYSQLREGKDDEALMVYINKSVNFHIYDSVLIDPVSIIVSEDSDMAKVSVEDRQKMANYFYAVLEQNLSNNYIIASKPGSLTMRLRVALTDIKSSQVVMDTVSTILPIGLAVDMIAYAATGTHTYVGSANAEIELLDSMTGQRLAAAVDGSSGRKITGQFDKFNQWKDVKDACDFWAQRISLRLHELATGIDMLKGG